MANTEEVAKTETQRQLQARGFSVSRSEDGVLEASKGGTVRRVRVKGLRNFNAVWLRKRDLAFVDALVVYVIEGASVWVLSKSEAQQLLQDYHAQYEMRHGRAPPAAGFNRSQLAEPTGWEGLEALVW